MNTTPWLVIGALLLAAGCDEDEGVTERVAVMLIYRVDHETIDAFGDAPPPEGVSLSTLTDRFGPTRRVASVDERDGESLEQTLERVRPWFDSLPNEGRRWVFDAPRDSTGVWAHLVFDDPIPVDRDDIESVQVSKSLNNPANRWVDLRWSEAGVARLERETTRFVGFDTVFVCELGVFQQTMMSGPMTARSQRLEYDAAYAQRVAASIDQR